MKPAPRTAIILARLSDLRDDDELGIDGQVDQGGGPVAGRPLSRC
jgi:hypothetical protein